MATTVASNRSPELVFNTLTSYQQAFALKAGIDLELFTAIAAGATDTASLAKRVNAAERGVRILADYLTILGFLHKENGAYSLTPDSAVFLDKRSGAYLGGMAEFFTSEQNVQNMYLLTDSVRKGGTASHIGDNSRPVDDRWVNFANSMGAMAAPMAGVLSQIVNAHASGPVRVLDVASGHGMYGITVARNNPNVHLTSLDWPAVLEVAKANAQKAGVIDRFRALPGSAFDADLGDVYDYIFITNFLHHFDIPTCETLLSRFRAALKPGGKTITVEFVPNEDRVSPPMAAAFSLVMLAHTDRGDAYTFPEYEKMHRGAGFRSCALQQVPNLPQSLIIGEK
jgi:hypothetical protein